MQVSSPPDATTPTTAPLENGSADNKARSGSTKEQNGNEGENDTKVSSPAKSSGIAAKAVAAALSPVKRDPEQQSTSAGSAPRFVKTFKRKNRGKRGLKKAIVQENKVPRRLDGLPSHQYETILVRRAVRKPTPSSPTVHSQRNTGKGEDEHLEIYGDTSLGMKLTVAEGKVIVQGLISLADGRASPAQLTGIIERGDVLLQINHQSLVNLPMDQLLGGLSPLSKPNVSGDYHRRLRLRFAAGQGLDLLNASAPPAPAGAPISGTSMGSAPPIEANPTDVFGLLPMVGGMPMAPTTPSAASATQTAPVASPFPTTSTPAKPSALGATPVEPPVPTLSESAPPQPPQPTVSAVESSDATPAPVEEVVATTGESNRLSLKVRIPLDEAISRRVAEERLLDKAQNESEFFAWNNKFSALLRRPDASGTFESLSAVANSDSSSSDLANLTSSDLLELGEKAARGAKLLGAIMEKVDRGSGRRSVVSLSATLSLYSRGSTRRRYVLDSKAMPVSFEQVDEEKDEDDDDDDEEDEDMDNNSDDGEDLNADDLLLRLAAEDLEWKDQVVQFLQDIIDRANKPDDSVSSKDSHVESALSNELGNFLFGDKLMKDLMSKKKPQSLPPDEITALLCDLANNVTSVVPGQIHAQSPRLGEKVFLTPITQREAVDSKVGRATRFLLNDVIPIWLKTFKPLQWEHRRVLWPVDKAMIPSESMTGESTRSDDSMTIDSMSTRQVSPRDKKAKNLREQIEDQHLDVETRMETCLLVTFYFTQHLIPKLLPGGGGSEIETIKSFVKDFGAYLKLTTCLAQAAMHESQELVRTLLDVARHDPLHREALRRYSKHNTLIFYEPSTLSAVVERLHSIHQERNEEQKSLTIHLCSQAYPDLRPWQVAQQCKGLPRETGTKRRGQKQLLGLYYQYLSQMLDPMDGHDSARKDAHLVREWMELSVRELPNIKDAAEIAQRKDNLVTVASKSSSDHLYYTRDLPLLLDLSMEVRDYFLAMELVVEILEESNLDKKSMISIAKAKLATIGRAGVTDFLVENEKRGERILKRLFRLLKKLRTTPEFANDFAADAPAELMGLIMFAKDSLSLEKDSLEVMSLVEFLARESSPKDFLLAMTMWSSGDDLNPELYTVLRTALRRGAEDVDSKELSLALRRVRQARLSLHGESSQETKTPPARTRRDLWRKMSTGKMALSK